MGNYLFKLLSVATPMENTQTNIVTYIHVPLFLFLRSLFGVKTDRPKVLLP